MPDRMERRTALHLWLTLLVALAVVAGVGATLIASRDGPAGDSGASPLLQGMTRIPTLASASLKCPADAAFSPDGARIVVLGLLATAAADDGCPAATDDTISMAALVIFDTATGQRARSIPLGPLARGSAGAGSGEQGHIVYSGLGWSPDGRHVAVVFTEFGGGAVAPENILDSGLLLIDTKTGTAATLRGDSGFFAAASGVSSGFPIWRLSQQAELPAFLPEGGLAYAWNSDGAPYPIAPLGDSVDQLPADAGPRYPVGVPDGDARYTIWQPGLVVGGPGGMDSSPMAFVSAFPAWSPDGENVTLMVGGVTLRGAGGSGQTGRGTTMRQMREAASSQLPIPSPPALPLAPPRDAALASVQREVGGLGSALVGWNPAGSLLASIDCAVRGEGAMEVRDTATGQILASTNLHLTQGDPGCRGGASEAVVGAYPSLGLSLAWSPVGDVVLLCDRAGDTLTLYHIHPPAAE